MVMEELNKQDSLMSNDGATTFDSNFKWPGTEEPVIEKPVIAESVTEEVVDGVGPLKVPVRFAGTKCKLSDLVNKTIYFKQWCKEKSIKNLDTTYYKIQILYKNSVGETTLGFVTTGAEQIVQVLDQQTEPFYATPIQVGRAMCLKEYTASNKETLDKIIKEDNVDLNKLT